MRENFPLAVAAVLIILSFGIVVLFVTVGIIESNTEGESQKLEYIFDNATEIARETTNSKKTELLHFLKSNSSNATRNEIMQFLNDTSNVIRNKTNQLPLQQFWENP